MASLNFVVVLLVVILATGEGDPQMCFKRTNNDMLGKTFTNTAETKSDVAVNSPFKLSIKPRDHGNYQVVIYSNNPTMRVSKFAVQSLDVDYRFVSDAQTSLILESCNHINDTAFQEFTKPRRSIHLLLQSTFTKASISFRYNIVDSKFMEHKGDSNIHVTKTKATADHPFQANPRYHQKTKRNADIFNETNQLPLLLVANDDNLHWFDMSSNRVRTLVLANDSDTSIYGVDYHYRHGHIYWTDFLFGKVKRSNVDGTEVVNILERPQIEQPVNLAIDWISNKLYYTEHNRGNIGVLDLEFFYFKTILEAPNHAVYMDIALDPTTRLIFWADSAVPSIERASMDGTGHITLHNAVTADSLTIDYENQLLYWISNVEGELKVSSTDGSNIQTLFSGGTGINFPYGLTIFKRTIVFGEDVGNVVRTYNLDNGEINTTIERNTCFLYYTLKAFSAERQPLVSNPCEGNSCSQLCLLSSEDPRGYSCHCSDGFLLGADLESCTESTSGNASTCTATQQGSCTSAGHYSCCVGNDCTGSPPTCYCDANCHLFRDCCSDLPTDCINSEPDAHIVYADTHSINRISFPLQPNSMNVRATAVVSGQSNVADIDYNYRAGHLFWSDIGKGDIWRCNFDGSGLLKIQSPGVGIATHISLDWITNKLYWLNSTDSTINVLDLSSGGQAILLNVSSSITDFTVHPSRREMFWTVSGTFPAIGRTSMDGENMQSFPVVGTPTSLTMRANGILWADTEGGRIVLTSFDGILLEQFSSGSGLSLSAISELDNTLYFVGQFDGVQSLQLNSSGLENRMQYLRTVGCNNGLDIKIVHRDKQEQELDTHGLCLQCEDDEICVLSSLRASMISCIPVTHSAVLENSANEFFIAFADNFGGSQLSLSVTTPESEPVNFDVTANGFTFSGVATSNTSTKVAIPLSFQVRSSSERDKGIRVKAETDKEVVVYGLSYSLGSSDAFLALPCTSLDLDEYKYYAVTYTILNQHPAFILIVACEDNTQVNVGGTSITLNQQETYLYESTIDLTGTRITSNRPVSVFSAQRCANVPVGVLACDHLVEQIPPTINWGSSFLVASLLGRTSGEVFRVLTTETTTVTVNCTSYSSPILYQLSSPGSWTEFEISPNNFCSIEATAPIIVMQYSVGGDRGGTGDPFMMMIPPTEQYSTNYVLVALEDFSTNYLTIYVSPEYYQPQSIFVDGSTISDWSDVYCSDRSLCGHIARVPVSSGEHPVYHQDPSARVGVSSYGFNPSISYGHPGGLKLTPLYQLLPTLGTCAAAGISTCCDSNNGPCMGYPPTCSCASDCNILNECCNDVVLVCQDDPLTFVIRPANQSVIESQNAYLRCSASDSTATISWTFTPYNSSDITPIICGQGFLITGVTGSSALTVSSAMSPDHAGMYTCTASKGMDSISSSAQLVIKVPPTVSVSSIGSVMELADILLICSIRAFPRAEVTWLKSSFDRNEYTQILSQNRITIAETSNASDQVNAALRVNRATASDSGVYVCQADNQVGLAPAFDSWELNISSIDNCLPDPCVNGNCSDLVNGYICSCSHNFEGANCHIEVIDLVEPTILESPQNTTVDVAMAVNLTCRASGKPAPSYQWYKDGQLIIGESRSYLYISEAHPQDRGDYECRAYNEEGEAKSSKAAVQIIGVLQYSVELGIFNTSLENLREITQSLISNELADTNTSVFSVSITNTTQSGELLDVTLTITLRSEESEQEAVAIDKIRSALISQLQQASSVVTTQNLIRIDGCASETYEGYSWPETSLGSLGTAPCPCSDILGEEAAGRTSRDCGGTYTYGALWSSEIYLSSCTTTMSETARLLCDIALGRSNDTVENSRQIANITSVTQNLTSATITIVATVIEQLGEEATTNPEVRENYLESIDNIQQADPEVVFESQMSMNSSTRILDSLGQFLDSLDLNTINGSANETTLSFRTFAMRVQDINPDDLNGQIFLADLGSVEQAMSISGRINADSLISIDDQDGVEAEGSNTTAFLRISSDFLNECFQLNNKTDNASTVSQRLSYSVFLSATLFQPENIQATKVGSIIVSPRLSCRVEDLENPIHVMLRVSDEQSMEEDMSNITTGNGSCGIFNDDSGTWSKSQCVEVEMSNGTFTCECSVGPQLGHFGILFDLNPNPRPSLNPYVPAAITYIGLVVSVLCLTIFIITNLFSKKLRSNTHNRVILNMAVSLLCLYIFFLIGSFTQTVPWLCGVVSALLQYFFLVFFCWTAVEGVWLYLKLVNVLGSNSLTTNFMLKAGLPAWLIPIVIVAISGGAGYEFYTDQFYCRPTHWPFYFGFILPFAIVYVFNWIMFLCIMVSICKHSRSLSVMKKDSKIISSAELKKNFIIALSLTILLGLGWSIGLLASSYNEAPEVSFTFQIIFAIFVGSQGVLIFILHGLRNADFRGFWLILFRCRKAQPPAYTVSSTQKGRTFPRPSGSDSGTASVVLSTSQSYPEKIDLSKIDEETTIDAYSAPQSPTDSVFTEGCEVIVNDGSVDVVEETKEEETTSGSKDTWKRKDGKWVL